jgi:hypothetical protein
MNSQTDSKAGATRALNRDRSTIEPQFDTGAKRDSSAGKAQSKPEPGATLFNTSRQPAASPARHRLPRQRLTRRLFVVVEQMFAAFHVAIDGGAHLGGSRVAGYDAARNLPRSVDPLDDPASAAPRLVNGR